MDFLFNTNVQFFLAAYLVGGIPFGLLLAKKFAGVDVKASGSGSIGATNVLRVVKESNPALAKKLGAATLALDAIKGVLVLLVASILGVSEATLWGIAVLAVIGHCYSPYLNFEGGKGIATGMGVMMFMLPYETLIALVVWAIGAKTIRISSVSSLTGVTALLISSFYIHPEMAHAPVVFIVFLLFYKHLPNIIRLFKGQEKRVV
ncbi:MAG: glycerol-3-phosphate 1-O-acyltransferase PlsY [Epsilonproteobacteria bacterium]|nr:glycerol-3-phosphate 1-O-acyltransferase PlsY [Campylobacterota bacterium]OIO13414.1 MAG: acyl-phosphate--glycerol-3-phosphate O-acyltransferase [Helicobacteraceae bacterium CG1_02_36_14]PIP09869.1 MAG: acyl-phosphate--glycerol-3-phosphate O-acyltransferase [Sulfurimonas sp. CG23_combo_of_CG06-09_8_20_14_all_36_33]PIS24085.1 MAG: acyl-phosphate--glycerol-3-phosphate O-acyltransferase [Sulfurimonas sp. CG08_land_8_20_14_0_20_36_33]PIU35569.1 MAG: acyl-phosphate--glycerol-3-phosphate O-acyltra